MDEFGIVAAVSVIYKGDIIDITSEVVDLLNKSRTLLRELLAQHLSNIEVTIVSNEMAIDIIEDEYVIKLIEAENEKLRSEKELVKKVLLATSEPDYHDSI